MAISAPKVSEIVALIKKGMTIEAQEKIMELRQAVLDQQEVIAELRNEIRELTSQLEFKKSLLFERGVYWLEKEGVKDGPFCQVCYDKSQTLSRLVLADWAHSGWSSLCHVCNIGNPFFDKAIYDKQKS